MTRQSGYLLPTEKEAPADAEAVSHKLMVRAGLVRQLGAGMWTYLPAGWRAHRRVEQILREEMDRIGAQEMKDCGFLTQLVAAGELDAAADRLAATLASMAPIPLLGMKKNLNRIARGVLDVDELRADMARAASSDDIKEGAVAWAEKRPPVFSGR